MIDVLRASTIMIYALNAGADCIIPCLHTDQAKSIAAQCPSSSFLLGGERYGKKITGFHLGNSPQEYKKDLCSQKRIIFTSTNGTRNLDRIHHAESVLIGSFANLNSLCKVLADDSRTIHLVCSGTNNQITLEDTLFAGAVIAQLMNGHRTFSMNDQARMAWASYQIHKHRIRAALFESLGAKSLLELGMHQDIETAAQVDTLSIVPELRNNSHIVNPSSPNVLSTEFLFNHGAQHE